MAQPDLTRQKVRQIFEFLKNFDQLKNPLVLRREQFEWKLSLETLHELPGVYCPYPIEENDHPDPGRSFRIPEKIQDRSIILGVKRPHLTSPPDLPSAELHDWIQGDARDPAASVTIRPSREESDPVAGTRTVRAEDDPARWTVLQDWLKSWREWATRERPLRQAMDLFTELYALHGLLEREGDRKELVVGDGILNWGLPPSGGTAIRLDHPLLLQTVELYFDAEHTCFFAVETDAPVELYSSLLQQVPGLSGESMAKIREEAEAVVVSPLGGQPTIAFLKRIGARLHPHFQFHNTPIPVGFAEHPRIGRAPLMFLRSRSRGYARAIEQVLEGLTQGVDIPESLQRLVGTMPEAATRGAAEPPASPVSAPGGRSTQDFELLFSKPWNPEQEEIARRLERSGSVIVQGPPGTGKTHTIANLVGHLLAHGQKILITSHTEKALRVLQGQVVEPLQPLCLPVLGSDIESRRELERSVDHIIDRLSRDDPQKLKQQARTLQQTRGRLIEQQHELTMQLLDSRRNEYQEILIGGQGISPSEGARMLGQGRGSYEWLPRPVEPGAALPLAVKELSELYSLNSRVNPTEEERLRHPLPALESLIDPAELEQLRDARIETESRPTPDWDRYWKSNPTVAELPVLESLLQTAQEIQKDMAAMASWQASLIGLRLRSESQISPWKRFLRQLDSDLGPALDLRNELFVFAPKLPPGLTPEEAIALASDIASHLQVGRKLGKLALFQHPRWKQLLDGSSLNGRPPRSEKDFQILAKAADLTTRRDALIRPWHALAAQIGFPQDKSAMSEPELLLDRIRSVLVSALEFEPAVWRPFLKRVAGAGFHMRDVEFRMATHTAGSQFDLIHQEILPLITGQLAERLRRSRQDEVHARFSDLRHRLDVACKGADSNLAKALKQSFERLDSTAYRVALDEVRRLHRVDALRRRREALLERLHKAAPGWAAAIRSRSGIHGEDSLPGDPEQAWRLRQIQEELDRRAARSPEEIARKLEQSSEDLRRATASLIEILAWTAQKTRTTGSAHQALIGWKEIIRRMPKTSTVPGKLEGLRSQARQAMLKCRAVVPAWIMPMHRVIEHFDFRTPVFDVIIVDEASQNDVFGLLLFTLARKIVVVGDHEQVSPSAVGVDGKAVVKLIALFLGGIPFATLYDGNASIYDLAKLSVSETIMLKEHFRCLPEIIEFSNQLCYDGRIRPLRDPDSSRVGPSFSTYRINGHAQGKVNRAEVESTASLVAACARHPAYRKLSFGVISLVGDEQAFAIDSLLRQHVPPQILERHRVVCGNSAHFQGDERDVMFLSMVDSPGEGPLRLRAETMFRQRFNVAVSRAKDQVWLVHSLNPETDLKPDDLRRRLLQHAADPNAIHGQIEAARQLAESEFETEVAAALIRRGYRVIPQYRVGYYRIDLVVQGGGRRLAVECDGDRFHPEEKLAEDLARQAILERLGWRFVRIRGSAFYRHREEALKILFSTLEKMGIHPQSETSTTDIEDRFAELQQEIIRRAEAIRMRWREEPEDATWEDDEDRGNDEPTGTYGDDGDSSEQEDFRREQTSASAHDTRGGQETTSSITNLVTTPVPPALPRRRGRPPKPRPPEEAPENGIASASGRQPEHPASDSPAPSVPRRRGRPPKPRSPVDDQTGTTIHAASKQSKPPGPAVSSDPDKILDDLRSDVWFALSHWAKEHKVFESWERKLCYDLGKLLKRGIAITAKQAKQGNRLLRGAVAHGFYPEESGSTQKSLFDE